jgi:hypothetical protein
LTTLTHAWPCRLLILPTCTGPDSTGYLQALRLRKTPHFASRHSQRESDAKARAGSLHPSLEMQMNLSVSTQRGNPSHLPLHFQAAGNFLVSFQMETYPGSRVRAASHTHTHARTHTGKGTKHMHRHRHTFTRSVCLPLYPSLILADPQIIPKCWVTRGTLPAKRAMAAETIDPFLGRAQMSCLRSLPCTFGREGLRAQ